jgi:hypothetical protein
VKIVFVGPTLPDRPISPGIEFRAAAALGDIRQAVDDGATVIGLIDGVYEQAAAVWHKEILYALSEGVQVFGGASMGALRAAECAAFGMQPVGSIALAYLSGEIDDDSAVALIHAPAEFGSIPLSEPLVDVWASVANLAALSLISADDAKFLLSRAVAIGFRTRTIDALVAGHPESQRLFDAYLAHRVSAKRRDALELVETVKGAESRRFPPPAWSISDTALWQEGRPRQSFNV